MTNSGLEPKDLDTQSEGHGSSGTPVPSTSFDCVECHGESPNMTVPSRSSKRRASEEDIPAAVRKKIAEAAQRGEASSSIVVKDAPYPPGLFTLEQEQELDRKLKNINSLEEKIKQVDAKLDKQMNCFRVFARWPGLLDRITELSSRYGDDAYANLQKKIDEENLIATDPYKMYTLMHEFFKNKQEMKDKIKKILDTCIFALEEEDKKFESGDV